MKCACKAVAAAATGLAAGCATSEPGAMGVMGEREDCPGKIVCPLTGEVICADQCPLEKPACCDGGK
jgi:hypothetical protein